MRNVILTPHIGGSTEEAQQDIGSYVAGKLRDYLVDGSSTMSVNLPHLAAGRTPRYASHRAPASQRAGRSRDDQRHARRAQGQHRGSAARDPRGPRLRDHRCRGGLSAGGADRARRDVGNGPPPRAVLIADRRVLSGGSSVVGAHVIDDPRSARRTNPTGPADSTASHSASCDPGRPRKSRRSCGPARQQASPICLQGGNTGLVGGSVPVDGAVLVSLRPSCRDRAGRHARRAGDGRRGVHVEPRCNRWCGRTGSMSESTSRLATPARSAAWWRPTPAGSGCCGTARCAPRSSASRRCWRTVPSSAGWPVCRRTTPATTSCRCWPDRRARSG